MHPTIENKYLIDLKKLIKMVIIIIQIISLQHLGFEGTNQIKAIETITKRKPKATAYRWQLLKRIFEILFWFITKSMGI